LPAIFVIFELQVVILSDVGERGGVGAWERGSLGESFSEILGVAIAFSRAATGVPPTDWRIQTIRFGINSLQK
jgi:hypothetical protein